MSDLVTPNDEEAGFYPEEKVSVSGGLLKFYCRVTNSPWGSSTFSLYFATVGHLLGVQRQHIHCPQLSVPALSFWRVSKVLISLLVSGAT
jgi:hypothetical protein